VTASQYPQFVVPFIFLVLIVGIPLWPIPTKVNYTKSILLVLNAQSTDQKMILNPSTNWKGKVWYCSILHEVKFLTNVTLRNNEKHEIVKSLYLTFTLHCV
jgi:hypothetical protein